MVGELELDAIAYLDKIIDLAIAEFEREPTSLREMAIPARLIAPPNVARDTSVAVAFYAHGAAAYFVTICAELLGRRIAGSGINAGAHCGGSSAGCFC